jgi:FkbM family methyltransferase
MRVAYNGAVANFKPVSKDDEIAVKHWSKGRFYEARSGELLDLIAGRRFRTVLDIGGHLGNHAVFYRKVMKVPHIICMEPIHYSLLAENLAANGMYDVAVLPFAASDCRQLVHLAPGENSGAWHISDKVGSAAMAFPADKFGYAPDFIKIDVEGHEIQVLHGCREMIDNYHPVLAVEIVGDTSEVDEFLGPFGYRKRLTKNATATYLYE